jgi:PST family polysaccharide transporter
MNRNSYGQILKSSALIGGSSAITIVLGVVRTKILALILGPAGMGIFGLFMSIYELARNVAVMGLNSSGVRHIAEANSVGDTKHIALTVATLRRAVALFGILGAALLAALCVPISLFSFKDASYAGGVALLAIGVFFGAVSAGQIALLQGMRRIKDQALANVIGALIGTLASIPIVYLLGERGIVPSLVCVALATLLSSWWFSQQVRVERMVVSLAQVFREASDLLKLGFVFMATGLMTLGAGLLIRKIVLEQLGKDAAGYYHAAWVLGGLYIGFILQAMGADFFPRLTAVAKDHRQCNQLVNEQAETGVLLAGPGILGTLTFAPLVIQIFYSAKFGPAVEILRWFCLGMMLRVASWPMGFILLAKGARRAFFWSELATGTLQLALVWLGVRYFGLNGAGIAFFGSYLFYWILIYLIVRSITGFRWSTENKRVGALFALLISAVFVGPYLVDSILVTICGAVVAFAAGVYSIRKICTLVPMERFPGPARRFLQSVGLVS